MLYKAGSFSTKKAVGVIKNIEYYRMWGDGEMEYNYEIIKMNEQGPLNIFLHNVKYVANHWHDHIEILFVLKGKVCVSIQNKQYNLSAEDLLLININEIHSIQSDEENLLLALQIPFSFLKTHYKDIDNTIFECKSLLHSANEQEKFNKIRILLAELMFVYSKEQYGFEIKIKSLLLQLIYVFASRFSFRVENDRHTSNKYMQRLLRISNFIKENYMTDISLQDISDKEQLSTPYISQLFPKYMGMSFSKYLSQVRMEYAVKDILMTDCSVIQIAIDNGFPNLKSFNKTFKEIFQTTPAQYRKGLKVDTKKQKNAHNMMPMYLDYDRENAYESLFKFLQLSNPGTSDVMGDKTSITKQVQIEIEGRGKSLQHSWRKLCSIGKAKEGLYVEVQQQLRVIQEKIGFEYIRFHGIFDDEMMVYHENEAGEAIFNFTYVDKLFSFLLQIGLRPFIELGFMPSDLASADENVFTKKSNISKPKDMKKWQALIRAFLLHCVNRYGIEEVRTWYIEFWNEPDTVVFWRNSFEEYCQFYQESYREIKAIDPKIKVGGPGILCYSLWKNDFLEDFLFYCRENNCLPDFITVHSYPIGLDDMMHKINYPTVAFEPNSEVYLSDAIQLVKEKLKKMNIEHLEIHITEWNSTPLHRDLTNDTCYKGAYIAKNVTENLDTVASLCYWNSTDLLEEMPLAKATFHGGLGLITINGIKKPGFYAFELLAKLGDTLVDKGSGYCLTRSHGQYQLLVYNYCHFDQLYGKNELLNINSLNRYHVFAHSDELKMLFTIKGIPSGQYTIRRHVINQEHGSAFDTWLEFGAPELFNHADIEYLNGKSMPKQTVGLEDIDGEWKLICNLEPHEVQLIEISPVYK